MGKLCRYTNRQLQRRLLPQFLRSLTQMSSFTILYEGKKKILKAAGPSALLQTILDEAAAHFGFDASRCSFKHKGKVVDVSVPVRLSGLLNLATLDLEVKPLSQSAPLAMTTISISVNGGEQTLSEIFPSSTSLQDILRSFIVSNQLPMSLFVDSNPEVIFFRSSFTGEDLSRTSLATLGLSGKAGKLQLRFQRVIESVVVPAQQTTAMDVVEEARVTTSATTTPMEQITSLLQSNFDTVSKPAVITLYKYLLNSQHDSSLRSINCSNKVYIEKITPAKGSLEFLLACGFTFDDVEGRLVLVDDKLLNDGLTALTHAMNELNIPNEERPVIKKPTTVNTTQMQVDFDPFRTSVFRSTPQPTRTAAETKSSTETQVDALRRKRRELEGHPAEFTDRNTEVLFPGDAASSNGSSNEDAAPPVAGLVDDSASSGPLPKGLIQRAMKVGTEDDTPLTTRALRELQKLEKEKVYAFTVLRIRFPDKVQLIGRFHVRHKITDIYTWVASCLRAELVGETEETQESSSNDEEELKRKAHALFTHGFELYMSPPRTVLQPLKGLPVANTSGKKGTSKEFDYAAMESEEVIEAGLVPAAVINLAWRQPLTAPSSVGSSSSAAAAEEDESANGSTGYSGPGWYLKDQYLLSATSKSCSGISTSSVVMPQGMTLVDKPVAVKTGGDSLDSAADSKSGASSSSSAKGAAAGAGGTKKKPSWFKL